MRLGFLALDRPDIQFGAKEAAPTHAEKMCQVPSTSGNLDMMLCSTTISVVYLGEVGYRLGRMPTYPTKHKRHISTFRTAHLVLQQHNALCSSSEAETFGVTKAFSRAIGMRNLAYDLGFERYGELSLEVQTDSSAPLAICQRRGWSGTLSSKLRKETHPKTLSSKNTFIQKHFWSKTTLVQNHFIQNRRQFRPTTLSSKTGFIQ